HHGLAVRIARDDVPRDGIDDPALLVTGRLGDQSHWQRSVSTGETIDLFDGQFIRRLVFPGRITRGIQADVVAFRGRIIGFFARVHHHVTGARCEDPWAVLTVGDLRLPEEFPFGVVVTDHSFLFGHRFSFAGQVGRACYRPSQ